MTRTTADVLRVYNGLRSAVEIATWSLTGLLVVIVTGNVFARYVLEIGVLWAEEVSRLAFVWVVFLGSYVALCRKGHMAMGLVVERLPTAVQANILVGIKILTMVLLASLTYAGFSLVQTTVEFGRTTPILRLSAGWGYASVPAASALMFIEVLRTLIMGEPLSAEEGGETATSADLLDKA